MNDPLIPHLVETSEKEKAVIRAWIDLQAAKRDAVIVGREPPPDDRDRQTGAAAVYALLGAGALLALAVAVAVLR